MAVSYVILLLSSIPDINVSIMGDFSSTLIWLKLCPSMLCGVEVDLKAEGNVTVVGNVAFKVEDEEVQKVVVDVEVEAVANEVEDSLGLMVSNTI